MEKNPVVAQREQMGMTRREFALFLGVNYNMLASVEVGAADLPKKWADRFAEAGVDHATLSAGIVAWRESKRLALKSAKGV